MGRELPSGFIRIKPIERIITPNGQSEIVAVTATNEELLNFASEAIQETPNARRVERTPHSEEKQSESHSFGFTRDRWKSPWEPKGPKKNWAPPSSQNPELN